MKHTTNDFAHVAAHPCSHAQTREGQETRSMNLEAEDEYIPSRVVNCEPLSLRVFHLVRCIANLES